MIHIGNKQKYTKQRSEAAEYRDWKEFKLNINKKISACVEKKLVEVQVNDIERSAPKKKTGKSKSVQQWIAPQKSADGSGDKLMKQTISENIRSKCRQLIQ